jgi:hypothetical protein
LSRRQSSTRSSSSRRRSGESSPVCCAKMEGSAWRSPAGPCRTVMPCSRRKPRAPQPNSEVSRESYLRYAYDASFAAYVRRASSDHNRFDQTSVFATPSHSSSSPR